MRRVAGQAADFQAQLWLDRAFTKVELYKGTNLVATAQAAPFTLTWTNIPLGNHEVMSRATDAMGCRYVSAPFVIEAVERNDTLTLSVTLDANGPALEFATENGARYNIQYSADMRDWKTDSTTLESVTGTVRWLDEGPPKTESAPRDTPVRFYRVVRQP